MAQDRDPFFVGYLAPPKALRDLMLGVALAAVLGFAGAAWLVAATQDDPGDGAFRGAAAAMGVLQATPYPVVHVTLSERFPAGTALLLTGGGKRGVQERADPLDGQLVAVSGFEISRGDIRGLQLAGGTDGMAPADGAAGLPQVQDLGRWRITGEICDGKCLAGAMRPGTGLSHKACANLCLAGGVPPVFVATGPVEGAEFLLIGDVSGGPIRPEVLDHTGTLVQAEGRVERRGGLTVFLMDPASVALAR